MVRAFSPQGFQALTFSMRSQVFSLVGQAARYGPDMMLLLALGVLPDDARRMFLGEIFVYLCCTAVTGRVDIFRHCCTYRSGEVTITARSRNQRFKHTRSTADGETGPSFFAAFNLPLFMQNAEVGYYKCC
ncbi:unnamed protein product [Ectocarpus fasciculatus]